jgi:glycosyltransferase involved in cell wall biosynthesis
MENKSGVLIIGTVPPPYGGVTVYTLSLINNLVESGIDYELLSLPSEKENGFSGKFRNHINWIRTLRRSQKKVVFDFELTYLTFSPEFSFPSFFKLLFRYFLILFSSKKWISFHFDGTLPNFVNERKWLRFFVRIQSWLLKASFVANKDMENIFLAHGYEKKQVILTGTFLPPRKYSPDLPGYLLSFVETHSPIIVSSIFSNEIFYNPEDLIGLFQNVLKEYPTAGLVILSEDALIDQSRPRLSQQVSSFFAKDAILVSGLESPYPLLKVADVFVRSASLDGDSITIKEALFLHTPVMAADNDKRPKGVFVYPPGSIEIMTGIAFRILKKEIDNLDENAVSDESQVNFKNIVSVI